MTARCGLRAFLVVIFEVPVVAFRISPIQVLLDMVFGKFAVQTDIDPSVKNLFKKNKALF